MISSDLIKLLQEADPSGNLHVRINGEAPEHVMAKPGYYDGPYTYMDGGKLVFSTEGDKVDIDTFDVDAFVWENFDDWEDKVEFHYTYLDGGEHEKIVREHLKKVAQEAREFDKESITEFSKSVMDKIRDGYKVIQKDTNVGYYNTMFFTKEGEEIKLLQGDCHAIIRGSFKPNIKEDHIEWEPK